MRLRFGIAAFLLVCLSSIPSFAQWRWGRPQPPRAGACFYRDSNFRGDYFCMSAGQREGALPPGFNDRISSIRVFGGARLRLFNNENFGGVSSLLDRDVFDLRMIPVPDNRSKNWNDRISSIAVFMPDRDEWDRGRRPGEGWRGRDDDDRQWHRGRESSSCVANPREGRRFCGNLSNVREARIVREIGARRCEFNRNWGVDRGQVWVADGCGAIFDVR